MSAPTSDEVRVGAILRETYEILALLGEGGMGSVFTARHLRLPKHVAVKVLKTDLSISPELVSRFRREAEIASRLGHPNIVEVLDFDTLPGGTPFLVLEFLRGESLGARLARGPLAWEDARSIAVQVGSALNAAHQAGVVHRDLKPDNIFLLPGDNASGNYRVKLLDFGISKLKQDGGTLKTMDAVLMGTPQYMSPEQALGKNSQVDARSDIFALGAIFYEMLAGQPAFQGENIPQVIYRIVHEQPPKLDTLVPGLAPSAYHAIERAMSKEPGARFADVAELTEAFTGTRLHGAHAIPLTAAQEISPNRPRSGTAMLDPTFKPAQAQGPAPIPLVSGNPPSRPPSGTAMLSAAELATPLPNAVHGVGTPAPAPLQTGAVIDARPVTPPPPVSAPVQATVVAPKRSAAPIVLAILATALLAGGVAWRMGVMAARSNQTPAGPNTTSTGTAQLPSPPPVTPTPETLPPKDPATTTTPTVATANVKPEEKEHHPSAAAIHAQEQRRKEKERERERKEEEDRIAAELAARHDREQEQMRNGSRTNGWGRRNNGLYPVDPDALAAIRRGEQAIKEGQGMRAVEHARTSQRFEMSAASHFVLVQAFCLMQDLGNANSEYAQLPPGFKGQARFFCAEKGVNLR